MEKNIIIIDDDKAQAEGLKKALGNCMPGYTFESYFNECEILDSIENRFYTLAIVDIRMDKYSVDGIDVVNKIFEFNPFAKVIIISAFKDEYIVKLKDLLLTGKVVEILDKKPLSEWTPELCGIIEKYYQIIDADPSEINIF